MEKREQRVQKIIELRKEKVEKQKRNIWGMVLITVIVAFAIYEEHKTAETARYLAKNAKKIAKKAMETNDLEMLTKLLEYDVFSKKSIRFIYDLISDDDNEKMVTTKAYALEKMQRRANKNNFSL